MVKAVGNVTYPRIVERGKTEYRTLRRKSDGAIIRQATRLLRVEVVKGKYKMKRVLVEVED